MTDRTAESAIRRFCGVKCRPGMDRTGVALETCSCGGENVRDDVER